MQVLALVWGLVVFAGFCVGLVPCLGWLNWGTIPLGIVGVVLGAVAMSRANRERQPTGPALAGLLLSLVAVVLGSMRLVLGGGLF
ncbi:MAG TPA: hypothetical protein VIC56_07410 [Gemmatimonadota bacterium]|jgi:hypothetical protein